MNKNEYYKTDEGKQRLLDAFKITTNATATTPPPQPTTEEKQEVVSVLGKLIDKLSGEK